MTPARTARRHFLRHSVSLAAGAVPGLATPARASMPGARGARHGAHPHPRADRPRLCRAGTLRARSLGLLNRFLRDHYTGEVGVIDPQVFDLLHRVRQVLGSTAAFEVISGYRGPATNSLLRATRGGGVASKSLHTEGRAIDVRLPGVALADLRDAALSLRAGGVGYYPRERFVHIDTGRVRHW